MGPCAKTVVICRLIDESGNQYVGENWCFNPQKICPRTPGEDYTKCKTICQQEGHAEKVALRLAGVNAKGCRAFITGHSYACRECQESLFAAGVISISIVDKCNS